MEYEFHTTETVQESEFRLETLLSNNHKIEDTVSDSYLTIDEQDRLLKDCTIFDIINQNFKETCVTEQCKQCSICLEHPVKGDNIREMPCGHIFHIDCIDGWLYNNTACPNCRNEVFDT